MMMIIMMMMTLMMMMIMMIMDMTCWWCRSDHRHGEAGGHQRLHAESLTLDRGRQ